jgi:hypothetical protein
MVTSVVSVDGSAYLTWQAELLRHSHRRVGQPGDLVILDDTLTVEGDVYPPYNRPYALMKWLERERPSHESVLVLDPDMVFVLTHARAVRRRHPIATDSRYQVTDLLQTVLRPYVAQPKRLQPIAVPMLIHHDDLRELAPLWLSYTMRLRADGFARGILSWICELWAGALAAHELGLVFEVENPVCLPPVDSQVDVPFIHYTWAFEGFDKRTYRPWEPLPAGGGPAHGYLRELITDLASAQ